MAIGANSYGTLAGVGALVPRYSGAGLDFAATTRPNAGQVEAWINQTSAILNAVLATAGFAIPVVQADAALVCANFVTEEVAGIVESVNVAGKRGPTERESRTRPSGGIMQRAITFVELHTAGLERLGATRTDDKAQNIAYRDADERGNATAPLFQRAAFGDDKWQKDWDS